MKTFTIYTTNVEKVTKNDFQDFFKTYKIIENIEIIKFYFMTLNARAILI